MNICFEYLEALLHLVYPKLCLACDSTIPIKGDFFCLDCKLELQYTMHFEKRENDFMQKFYGRISLEFGAALYNYYSGHILKNMLHGLKYKRRRDVGLALGRLLGVQLSRCAFFEKPDVVIPVPIHKKRRKIRAYNQAELIASEISKTLDIPLKNQILTKVKNLESQTRKSRYERSAEIDAGLCVNQSENLIGLHVLLVDDILTTGATLEACALKLKSFGVQRFSFVTLAITKTV